MTFIERAVEYRLMVPARNGLAIDSSLERFAPENAEN